MTTLVTDQIDPQLKDIVENVKISIAIEVVKEAIKIVKTQKSKDEMLDRLYLLGDIYTADFSNIEDDTNK